MFDGNAFSVNWMKDSICTHFWLSFGKKEKQQEYHTTFYGILVVSLE